MSVRRILVLSLAGALMLAGAVVAVARLGGEDSSDPDEKRTASPSPSPSPTLSLPGSVPGSPGPPPAAPAPPAPPAPAPAPPPAAPDPPGYKPITVTPRPGMANLHPVNWRRADVVNERTVRVHFESGVAPCSVLDHVEVQYRPAEIAISLFEGNDPAMPDAVCIMIAQFKTVDVALDEPVNARRLVDGAA